MSNENIEDIQKWVSTHSDGYDKYMRKYYPDLYIKFCNMNFNSILPPQRIGGCISIMRARVHTDEDYNEMMKVSKEFCDKYPDPYKFPKDF